MNQLTPPPIETPERTGRPIWMNLLIGCGALGVVGCCVLTGFFGWGMLSLRDALPEAKAFVQEAFPAVAQPWNAKEMERRFADDPVNTVAKWQKLFKMFSAKLGNLKEFNAKEPSGWNMKNWNGEVYVELRYIAKFEKANGDVTLVLHKNGKQWEFWLISIDSPALYEP